MKGNLKGGALAWFFLRLRQSLFLVGDINSPTTCGDAINNRELIQRSFALIVLDASACLLGVLAGFLFLWSFVAGSLLMNVICFFASAAAFVGMYALIRFNQDVHDLGH